MNESNTNKGMTPEDRESKEQQEQYLLNIFRQLTPENRARLILIAAALL